jgi:hypothetical protein
LIAVPRLDGAFNALTAVPRLHLFLPPTCIQVYAHLRWTLHPMNQ